MRACSVTLLALLAVSGCASQPPAFWKSACANETAEIRHETPAPDGMVVPERLAYDGLALDILVLTGAKWVDANISYALAPMDKVFPSGSGRYRFTLTKLAAPDCREALRLLGYDPSTREPVSNGATMGSYANALQACTEIKFLSAEVGALYYSEADAPTPEYRLKNWTAPYVYMSTGGLDPRSPPDAHVSRRVDLIIHRDTGNPIWERAGYTYMQTGFWGPRMMTCGATWISTRYQVPRHVFAPSP